MVSQGYKSPSYQTPRPNYQKPSAYSPTPNYQQPAPQYPNNQQGFIKQNFSRLGQLPSYTPARNHFVSGLKS